MLKGFLDSVHKFPNQVAIISDERTCSYKELHALAWNIAGAISKYNIQNSLIGIYTDNNIYTYASILAVLMSGNGFVPLNSKFPDERLKNIMAQSEMKLVIACENSQSRVEKLGVQFLAADKSHSANTNMQLAGEDPGRIAYLLFTSGSTGVPKGIPITYGNFNSLVHGLSERYRLRSTDKVLQTFELSFDVSIGCTFLAWQNSAALVLVPLSGIVAVNAFKTILDYQVNFVTMAPSAMNYMKKYKMVPQIKLPFVTTTVFTGEALPYEIALAWQQSAENTVIDNAYGPTEASVWCYFYRLGSATGEELVNGLCPIGNPLPGIKSRIVNETGKSVLKGDRGELLISGAQVFSGYWKNESKTNEAFMDEGGKKWYRTGDIVTENVNGNVIYINRKDNQVKINGFRIEIGEVEYAIKKVAGIQGVAVVVGSSANEPELIAFVEKARVNKEQIIEELKKQIPFYMIPRDVIFIDSLPLNSNGKTDRVKLRELLNGSN